jgi:hypothetical protein
MTVYDVNKLDLNDVELKTLDLMIAVKEKNFSFISDIADILDGAAAVAEVTTAVAEGGTTLSDALKAVVVPGQGVSLEALVKLRDEAMEKP